jgi:hypothetical protein
MKTILFKKNGSLLLVDKLARDEEKIDTLKYYLDCPVILEEGITFGTFFNHIFKEKDFLNIVFKETMGESNIDKFLMEWMGKGKPLVEGKGIQYIKAYKIFDYIETLGEKGFVDIRLDFDGIGVNDQLYNLEFMPLNELKTIPLVLSNDMSIYRTVANMRGEELFFNGSSFTLLFELIGTILYIITIHKTPAGRESAKKKFIKILGETNLVDLLEEQKEDAVEDQNYEEAAQLKKILDRLRNGFINE